MTSTDTQDALSTPVRRSLAALATIALTLSWTASAGAEGDSSNLSFRAGQTGASDSTMEFFSPSEVSDYLENAGFDSVSSPLVVPAASFVRDGDVGDSYFDLNDGFIRGNFFDCVQAPVYLPDGATVTSLFGYLYDNEGEGENWVSLWRKSYADDSVASMMAEVESTGSMDALQTLGTSTVSDGEIDNDSYVYYLAACFNSDQHYLNAVAIHFDETGFLNVASDSGETQVLVQETSGTAARRQMFRLENNGAPEFSLVDQSVDVTWKFGTRGTGFEINRGGSGQTEMLLNAAGNLTITGTLSQGSSRTLKKDFEALDSRRVLDRVNELSLLEWSYKTAEVEDRHFGPMAEDFHQSFGLGADPERLAPGDAVGIALAAIQGLNGLVDERMVERDAEIAALHAEIEALKSMMEEIAR